MAKDYRGVLLIMLAMLRSTRGRAILNKYRSFKEGTHLDDWILLVEVMLEWESYLNEPLMQMKHVKRMDRKHRYIMYVMRKVARRSKGMGLKLTKFHMILHIWEDIIQFGVPLEFRRLRTGRWNGKCNRFGWRAALYLFMEQRSNQFNGC